MKIKKYIQNALAKFIFDEELETIRLGIKVAQMPIKAEDTATTTDEPREDVVQTLHDHESRINDIEDYESRLSTVEDFEYKIDELESGLQEMKDLAEQTEVEIDELKNTTALDFPEEFTKALAQPEFVTLIETIIKNEREKSKKKPSKKKKA